MALFRIQIHLIRIRSGISIILIYHLDFPLKTSQLQDIMCQKVKIGTGI